MCPKSDVKEGGALTMVPQEAEADQAEVWDYAVNKVTEKSELAGDSNVKASQFHKPLLEFSGSCAGCAETSYARLVTQLFGDRMFISNATGCSSIWGNPAATCPYTTNAEGHGPAWNNSLFEDNAEHGFGMEIGYEAERDRVVAMTEALLESGASDELKAAATAWLEARNDADASKTTAAAFVKALEAAGTPEAEKLLAEKSYLTKKSFWVFGGDGWAYDIGFGGLDHVLAQNRDVNVFVFDTEVYSNTGGQASKASNLGQVAQFAAAGKTTKKKSLAEIAMSYGYIYVAQVAMGANPMQTLKAIREAEAYNGPSLIIGYSEACRRLRLLEPLPLRSFCARWQEVLARLQGAEGWLPGLPDERGSLCSSRQRVPRPCSGALRRERGGRNGSLRAPSQAQGHVRRRVVSAE